MIEGEVQSRRDGHSFTVRRIPGGMSVVTGSGDVDGEASSVMGRLLVDELAKEPAQLVLELTRTTSVDSAFVEALVGASTLAGESDTSFCLVASPANPVVKALAAADLIERFEIFTTVGMAMLHR